MYQTPVVGSLRKRLIAAVLGLAVLAAAVASYPMLTTGDVDELSSYIYENTVADPSWGDGDGNG